MQLTCLKCGWVHFGMTREEADKSVADFNAYFDSLSEEKQKQYYNGRRSIIDEYEHCFRCGNHYSNFREALEGDCPRGSTIQPILIGDKKYE